MDGVRGRQAWGAGGVLATISEEPVHTADQYLGEGFDFVFRWPMCAMFESMENA